MTLATIRTTKAVRLDDGKLIDPGMPEGFTWDEVHGADDETDGAGPHQLTMPGDGS